MRIEEGISSSDRGCRNDCTVRALANGFGLKYEDAAALAKANGRKRKNTGLKYNKALAMFDAMPNAKRVPILASRLWVLMHQLDPGKTYVVIIKAHAFVVKHGLVLDHTANAGYKEWLACFMRRPVLAMWEVGTATTEPVQLSMFN